ncbi:MAG: hypothetical protein GX758_03620 [Tenericutes bacterium]|nr:hypothetical protein [Mycoplasmatota bacterium]
MEKKLEFKSLSELYNRVLPALYSKTKEIKRQGYKYITEKDIWNYLVVSNWQNKNDLQLYELISDILYSDSFKINEYVMEKMNRLKTSSDNIDTEVL